MCVRTVEELVHGRRRSIDAVRFRLQSHRLTAFEHPSDLGGQPTVGIERISALSLTYELQPVPFRMEMKYLSPLALGRNRMQKDCRLGSRETNRSKRRIAEMIAARSSAS